MIVVFGPNLAVDRTMEVPDFRTGRVYRTQQTLTVAGGKGANVARALQALGETPHLVGVVAGWTGDFIRDALDNEDIPHTLIEVPGLSRTCSIVVDPDQGEATVINEAGELHIGDQAHDRLVNLLQGLFPHAQAVVCSGSLPPGLADRIYATILSLAGQAGKPTILDANGAALAQGIKANPNIVKPNAGEMLELAGLAAAGTDDLDATTRLAVLRYARGLVDQGVGSMVISLGSAGAMGISPAGCWQAQPPPMAALNPTGSGDSMVAALAFGLVRKMTFPETLALGVAAGTANAASFGGGRVTKEAVYDLLEGVKTTPIPT